MLEFIPSHALSCNLYQCGDYTIKERSDLMLFAIALERGNTAPEKLICKTYACKKLPIGTGIVANNIHLLRMTIDQVLVMAPRNSNALTDITNANTNAQLYITDLSGGMTVLQMQGSGSIERLQFVSMLDIATLPNHHCTRTLIDHSGHYIYKISNDEIFFFSMRSLVASLPFLHQL